MQPYIKRLLALHLNIFVPSVFKGTVMQNEKVRIDDLLCISKVSWKFRISNIILQ